MDKSGLRDTLTAHARWLSGRWLKKPLNHYEKCADFSGEDLSWMALTGLNLQGVSFKGANLHGTNFYGSDLRTARFDNADLSYADFRGTYLTGATFIGTLATGALWPPETQTKEVNMTSLEYLEYISGRLSHADKAVLLAQWAKLALDTRNGAEILASLTLQQIKEFREALEVKGADKVYTVGDFYTGEERTDDGIIIKMGYNYIGIIRGMELKRELYVRDINAITEKELQQ